MRSFRHDLLVTQSHDLDYALKKHSRFVILDRDGVINRMVIDQEHGTIDSPLNESEVRLFPWAVESLRRVSDLGYGLAIATNQPAAAKLKTTKANLELVHDKILSILKDAGISISTSQICFHRAEDGCTCRKPQTGLLDAVFRLNPDASRAESWMVGDGVTDVQAGLQAGLKTAFLAPRKCDACHILDELRLKPLFWGETLLEFVEFLEKEHP